MLDSLNPHSGSVSIRDALGPLNADYYYGDTTIKFRSAIKGVAAQWGNLSVPFNYDSTNAKLFFDQRIPVIGFHGLQDTIVDPGIKATKFAPLDIRQGGYGNLYTTESSCLISSPFITSSNPSTGQYTYGTLAYAKYILQPLGIRYEVYEDCDGGHGLTTGGSDYGTGYTNPAQVRAYITGRVATFFQSILGNVTQPGHKIFVECRNNAVGCSTTSNDAGCSNTDTCPPD